jgi:hypothetical protein
VLLPVPEQLLAVAQAGHRDGLSPLKLIRIFASCQLELRVTSGVSRSADSGSDSRRHVLVS